MQDNVMGDQESSSEPVDVSAGAEQTEAEKIDQETIDQLLTEQQSGETEALLQQVTDANDQVLRIQAEMQNVRRRAERDVENAHKYALDKFTADLLPVVDNLERALGTINADDETQKAVATGVELTLKSFLDVLARFNIEVVDPAGQPFDADLHQAVSMVPNPNSEPNTVIDVFQKGYTLNGRLVRPAMVVVSKAE
ncbi:nucleotide exchange factor GrpE [Porticoccaceae bacterium]|nr:nucleotide exchange factor GrpE [Porticoccaceae bacterium]MDB2344278.1 nucleotide exchange factor GrpE [Porticoccaceae bacterium]